jgi:hypothetical protein
VRGEGVVDERVKGMPSDSGGAPVTRIELWVRGLRKFKGLHDEG